MNLSEYSNVEKLDYEQYCHYLQNKYGIPEKAYLNKNWNKNQGVSRTNEGLYIHHIKENKAIMLSTKEFASLHPYSYQTPKNLTYCNLLEHLFLHILICEEVINQPKKHKKDRENVGVGGAVNFLIPELNDVYSGWETKQPWRKNCHNIIINNKDVYLILLKRFYDRYCIPKQLNENILYTSLNSEMGLWNENSNVPLYKEIHEHIKRRSLLSKILNCFF